MNLKGISKRLGLSFALATGLVGGLNGAESPPTSNAVVRLPEVLVSAESEFAEAVQGNTLPPVQGTRINSGKKTVVSDLDELPTVVNNNYRQAFTRTPGLMVSEETTPLVSIGYRGLPPHRAQFTQMLQDGLPIHADLFGYPESYYTPPLDTVDRLEFIGGGASLMYGPQPGGALNYVTHLPRKDRAFSVRSQHIFGSDNLYSTFNSIDGTEGRVGYYAYFHHRQTDGFRKANSDVDLFTGSAKVVLDADTDSRWIFTFDGYSEDHGEPGGLTFIPGATAVRYDRDREASSRLFDRFHLERYFGSLAWEKDFSETTKMTVKAWGGYYERLSHRQRGGGFGTLPSGTNALSNTIELQQFYTEGLEARLRHDWTAGDNTHTLAGGFMLYHNFSPRTDRRGASAGADTGMIRNRSDRESFYAPIFLENRFVFGKFSITPGLRLENFQQKVEEEVNVSKTVLGEKKDNSFVPLVGLGVEYEVAPKQTFYANASQSYRPKIFTEAVPTGANALISRDLEEGESWQYEIGFRGQPKSWLFWDVSLFYLDLKNQIGSIPVSSTNTTFANVGRAVHRGAEAAFELDLFGLHQEVAGREDDSPWGSLSWYGNVMLLDAKFEEGPSQGKSPQYAPDYLLRTGLIYRWRERGKIAFTGTFSDNHFADDANSDRSYIPAYATWDLTFEWKIYKNHLTLIAGINNLFNEDYYSRIRPDGIDPAYGRNYYAGFSASF